MSEESGANATDRFRWDKVAHQAVRDLHDVRPAVFWADFLGSAVLGLAALALAVRLTLASVGGVAALVISALALYRALCFMHEITHVRPGSLPGFESAWNLLIGVPLLMPSFIYTHGVHQNHHSLATYGTTQDPEYLPFASSHRMTIAFAAQSVLIPIALVVRFVVLGAIALVWPRAHRVLVERASALAMHPRFTRKATPALLRHAYVWQAAIVAVWGTALWLAFRSVVPWSVLLVWYATMAIISVVNVLRTLGAHHYESEGASMDRSAQVLDSIETPGAWWTEIWAPVGLRYHALHHYFPGIPYHNLPEAHRRLLATLPNDATFPQTLSPSLPSSLRRLLATGRARVRAVR